MSLMERLRTLDDFFSVDSDQETLEWLTSKSDEELIETIESLRKEKEIAIRLHKDITLYHNNIKTAEYLIEYRALKKLSKKIISGLVKEEEVVEEIGGISIS
tara:strand:+ start:386 stop:691 length:306 start_codon:yes stop_codon:yes gene_type:complete